MTLYIRIFLPVARSYRAYMPPTIKLQQYTTAEFELVLQVYAAISNNMYSKNHYMCKLIIFHLVEKGLRDPPSPSTGRRGCCLMPHTSPHCSSSEAYSGFCCDPSRVFPAVRHRTVVKAMNACALFPLPTWPALLVGWPSLGWSWAGGAAATLVGGLTDEILLRIRIPHVPP